MIFEIVITKVNKHTIYDSLLLDNNVKLFYIVSVYFFLLFIFNNQFNLMYLHGQHIRSYLIYDF